MVSDIKSFQNKNLACKAHQLRDNLEAHLESCIAVLLEVQQDKDHLVEFMYFYNEYIEGLEKDEEKEWFPLMRMTLLVLESTNVYDFDTTVSHFLEVVNG